MKKRTQEDASMEEWTKRSVQLGDSLNGVLFKGLPDVLNEHIHRSHLDWIELNLKTCQEGSILDVGCGYGRVSAEIIKNAPGRKMYGMDFVKNYAGMYRKHTNRPAFVGSITDIPCPRNYYDAAICVTVLMYLDDGAVDRALGELLASLRQGGTLILIEPDITGKPFQTAFGIRNLFRRETAKQEFDTGGRWFKNSALSEKIRKQGGTIIADATLPLSTLLFLPMYVVAKLLPQRITQWVLGIVRKLDRLTYRLPAPTLYKMYAITRRT